MPYHHGDLRRALLDAAVEVIEQSGVAALSLRDLARRVGVSHAAPTHHFGDKAGLLTALAAAGYERLAAALSAADGDFVELGLAYVRFALDNRAYFDVMFRPDLYRSDDPAVAAAREQTSAALYSASPAGQVGVGFGVDGAPSREIGVAGWSIAHGLATLWLNGSLPPLGPDRDAAIRAVLGELRPH